MSEHNRTDAFGQGTNDENTMYGSQQQAGGMAESVRQTAGEAVNTATTRVKESAGAVADQARQTVDQATRQAKSEISDVTSQVRQQADSMITEQKDMAADRLGTLAGTLRQASRQLQEQEEGTMGRYADVIADQIDTAADFLRQRNPGDLLGDLQRLARRQPEMFVAGSLAVGFLIGRFIKGPSRSALRQDQYNPAYYGQGGYQSGYQGSGYQSSRYQGGAYQSGSDWGSDYQSGGYQSGSYRGSDNPAEGTDSTHQAERFRSDEYQGRYESSGFQGNVYQQGGQESSGYQAEGADPDENSTHAANNYAESYEGGSSAYETGPTVTEGSDTDYPRYDPKFGGSGSEGDQEGTNYTPSSRR